MNGSQLMGLDSVGAEIYDIHGYFCRLIVSQLTLGFGVSQLGFRA